MEQSAHTSRSDRAREPATNCRRRFPVANRVGRGVNSTRELKNPGSERHSPAPQFSSTEFYPARRESVFAWKSGTAAGGIEFFTFADCTMMPRPIDERLPYDIYMTLDTEWPRSRVNALFSERGWASRMCSWTEHEITSDFAELIMASESPMFISGGVDRDPKSIDKILAILDDAGVAYDFDVYDENDRLLRSKA